MSLNQNKETNNNLKCKFCKSDNIELIIDFHKVALAGGFLTKEQIPYEKKYDQQLYFCKDCYLLQIINYVDPKVLFNDYFYFSSAINTLKNHFKEFAKEVTERFLKPEKAMVLEIGCNDGVLLYPFSELNIKTLIGVDPSTNVINKIVKENIITINDFFTEKLSQKIIEKYGYADMIVANNVFAHVQDMFDLVNGIKKLLSENGVFIFEVHYIDNLINELQYDMIYHEHLYYYSLIALENFFNRFDMEIFDIKSIPIHGGSMRYYVRKKGCLNNFNISKQVHELKQSELDKNFNDVETYLNYAREVNAKKDKLLKLLDFIKNKEKKIIYGYGASGRANTMIQYCGINNSYMECIIDDAPAKHGFYTPGSHFLIRSREYLISNPPDYILVFAWSFINEILNKNLDYIKNGGKLIIPLPEVSIISYKNGKIENEKY